MHPIMKQALEPFAPKDDPKADLLDLIETAISDSMDIDWTSRFGAEHVYRAIVKEGRVAEWQPIDTAPKDGTWIQLWRSPAEFGTRAPLIIGRWHSFDDGDAAWVWPDEVFDPFSDDGRDDANDLIARGAFYEATDFTHWMSLPTPPSIALVDEAQSKAAGK